MGQSTSINLGNPNIRLVRLSETHPSKGVKNGQMVKG